MALKEVHDHVQCGPYGNRVWRCAKPAALDQARRDLHGRIECNKFIQFEFDRQWSELKTHCECNGIRIMGDVPIYVAQDSSDVWAAHAKCSILKPTANRV